MLHKTATATATTTDLGEFTAIAAAYTLDRQGEQIRPGAFAQTIAKWKASDRQVPLHWNHAGEAENVIGSIDPGSMVERSDGLYVEGKLDLDDSEVAREAWRSMKANRVALSFGFMVTDEAERPDGVRELRAIDLFEISIVPSPANPDTRILSTKTARANLGVDFELPTEAEIQARVKELEVEQQVAELAAKSARPIQVARFEC